MILFRYIIREHIAPFFFGLSLIIFLFVMNLLFKMLGKIAGKGLPLMTVLEFFGLSLAWILALAVPMAVLISTLAAYGRLSGDGEITALRASGLSPGQLIRPALIGGLLVTAWVFYFNNSLLPDLNHRTKLLQIDIARKKPVMNIEPDIYNTDIPNYVVHATGVDQESGILENLTIYDEHDPGKRSTIAATQGKLKFVEAHEAAVMTLKDGEIHRPSDRYPDGYEFTEFDSALFRLQIPGMSLKRGNEAGRGDRELSIVELRNRIRDLETKSEVYNQRRIAQYWVEIHKKFSIPAACIVFILLGAPLGMMSHKGGLGVSGTISVIFFMIYWAILGEGEDFADRGLVSPAISMWFANVVLGIAGLWFLWMSKRRTTLPGMNLVSNILARLFIPPEAVKKRINGKKAVTPDNKNAE